MVVCDNCGTTAESTANYCPSCGSELFPTQKDWSDGFLSPIARSHILDAMEGNRSPPDQYHDRLYESVRHALVDFCLLNEWDEFNNYEALLGDLPNEVDLDDDDALHKVARLTCLFRFVYGAVGREGFEEIMNASITASLEREDVPEEDISVSISTRGGS